RAAALRGGAAERELGRIVAGARRGTAAEELRPGSLRSRIHRGRVSQPCRILRQDAGHVLPVPLLPITRILADSLGLFRRRRPGENNMTVTPVGGQRDSLLRRFGRLAG